MGTGSYVDPSLHWYRSTLAHNAPFVNGRSQQRVHGRLLAYDERDAAGWISAAAEEIAPGASIARTIVVMLGYLIDEIEWRADQRIKLDVPLHVDARIVGGAGEAHADRPSGGPGIDDGFDFIEETTIQRSDADSVVELCAQANANHRLAIWWCSNRKLEWWRAAAPAPPGRGRSAFWFARAVANTGMHHAVWSWSGAVTSVQFGDALTVMLDDGVRHVHRRTDAGWEIDVLGDDRRDSVALAGLVAEEPEPVAIRVVEETRAPTMLWSGVEHTIELGESHYRGSEQTWHDAACPSAVVSLLWNGETLRVVVTVHESDLTFVPAGTENPYDNEPMDINGDGVQLYLRAAAEAAGWLLVPERDSSDVRIRSIEGWRSQQPIASSWRPAGAGYEMTIDLSPATGAPHVTPRSSPLFLDLLVNEKPAGRERRRGQLVLSGASREFVYLAGDRHDPLRLLPFVLGHG